MNIERALLTCALLSVFGCDDGDDKLPSLPCDVRERACQRAVFAATKKARGQTSATLPPIRVIKRAQLEQELREELAEAARNVDADQELQDNQDQLAMSLLHLLPPPSEKSSDEAYIEQSVESIAAYYSSWSKDITIISDQVDDEENGTVTLSHELVHALQDQREHLDEWRSDLVDSSDTYNASKSLTEGEATWLSNVTFGDAVYGLPPDGIPRDRLFDPMLSGMLGYLEEQDDAPLIAAQEMLPYPIGGRFVADVHVEQGLDAVAALYDDPPLTLRAFVEPKVATLPEPMSCDLPAPPAGYVQLSTDELGLSGMIAFHVALQETGRVSYESSADWRADRLAVYVVPGKAEEVAIAWRIRLSSDTSAALLAAQAQSIVRARASGREVLLTAARDVALLDSWRPLEAPCQSPTKGRSQATNTVRRSRGDVLGIIR